MRRSNLFAIVVLLGLFLTSCQESKLVSSLNATEPTGKEPTLVTVSTSTIPISSLTPIPELHLSPSSTTATSPSKTSQPESSFTPLPQVKLNERGVIWILQDAQSSYFQRLNLVNEEITSVYAGGNCAVKLLPGTEEVICEFPGGYVLHNLVTGKEQQLPIKDTCGFHGWSPNGRFLLYEYCGEQGNYIIATYDLVEQIEQEIAVFTQPWEEREWYAIPLISYDGTHLVIYSIYEIAYKTSERRQFVFPELTVTDDFALSPTANQIVYGVTDIEQEIGIRPNHLYIYDFGSGENNLLATAPEGKLYDAFYSTPIWSPDGSKVVITSGSYLCIVEIASRKQVCHDMSPYKALNFMTWSPGSQYVALDAGYWGNPVSDLIIFDITKESSFVLLSNLELKAKTLEVLFWR